MRHCLFTECELVFYDFGCRLLVCLFYFFILFFHSFSLAETEEVAASQEGIEETEGKGSAQGMIGETDNSSLGSRPSTTTSRPMTSGSRPLTMENHSKPESPAKRIIAKQSLERQDSGLSEFLDTDLDDAEKLIAEIAQKLEDDIIETRRESIRAKQSAQGAHERVTSTNDQMKEDVTELRERIAKLEKGGSSAGADAVPSAMLSQTKAAVDDTTGRLALVEDAVAALEMALGLEEPLLKRAVSEVGDGAKKLAGMVGRLKEMNHKGNMNPVDKETLDKVVTDTAELKKFTTLSLQQQSIAIAGLRDEVYQRLDDIYAGGAAPSTSNGGVGGGRITDEEMVKRLNRLGPFLGSVALKGALDSKVSREEMMQLTRAINETRAAIVPYDDKDIVKKLGKLEKFVKEKLQGLDGMDIQMTLEILQKKIKSTGAELRREYLDTFERIKRVHKEIAGQMDTVKKRLETKAPKDDVEQLRREVFEEQAASITKTSYMCISCNRPYTKTELGPEVWERERQKQADELNSHRAAIEASTTLAARSAAGQLDREEGESSDTPRKDKKAKKQRGVVQLPFSDGLELQNSSSSNLVNASFKPEPPRGSQFKMNRPSPRGGISKESEKGLALLEKERSEQLTPRREEKGGGQSVESGLVVTLPARMVRQDTTTSSAGEDSSLPALSQTTSATTLGTPRKAAAPVDPVVAEGWPETPKTGQ